MKKASSSTKGGVPTTPPSATATVGTAAPSALGSSPKTTPHDIFLLCIERAQNLLRIHKTAHGSQARPEIYLSDAHRAAIVLAISALDAFIRTFVIEKIRDVWTNKSKTLPQALVDQIRDLVKDEQILDAARKDELLSRLIRAFSQSFETKSFQGVKNISQCLQLAGYEDIFHQVAIAASMNEDKLKEDIGRFTKRRHVIAHQGDHDLTQNPPLLNPIRKKDAEECIRLVTTIAKVINSLS
jgi:hypothetical protein